MTDALLLREQDRQEILRLLARHLPNVTAWAYGSRVNGGAHEGSDLDIVLRSPDLSPIPLEELRAFVQALRDSNIPILVEARDWARLPESFQREIMKNYVVMRETVSEWKTLPIHKVGQVITGKTPSKDNPEDWGDEMPFITPSDYKFYNKKAFFSERNLSNIGKERLEKKILPPYSVLITCIGSDMGKVVMNAIPVITNQQINSIVPYVNLVDNHFLYYSMLSMYDILKIYGGDGTAVPIVNKGDFENLEIDIPPLHEQKAIASVLSSLDDKIDLLHRQNKTLEEMAEALFRQWLEEKEFQGSLFDIIEIQNGFAFKSKDFRDIGSNSVVKINNIFSEIVDVYNCDALDDSLLLTIDCKFRVSTGDILFAMTGANIGKMGIVPKNNRNIFLNQRVGLLREKYAGARFLAYLQLKSDYGQDYIENTATGSAQPNISATGILGCGFPVLSEEEIKRYSEVISVLYNKKIYNLGQIRTIEKLRDTLLPKMMSGEVRVAC